MTAQRTPKSAIYFKLTGLQNVMWSLFQATYNLLPSDTAPIQGTHFLCSNCDVRVHIVYRPPEHSLLLIVLNLYSPVAYHCVRAFSLLAACCSESGFLSVSLPPRSSLATAMTSSLTRTANRKRAHGALPSSTRNVHKRPEAQRQACVEQKNVVCNSHLLLTNVLNGVFAFKTKRNIVGSMFQCHKSN